MKKTFRIVSILMVCLMTVSMFAACGEEKKPSESSDAATTTATTTATATLKKNVTLKMWGGVPPESGPQAVCDNFNEKFADNGWKLEYERFVNDDNGNIKLDTNLLAGNDIDLYMTYSNAVLQKRAAGKMALELTDLIKRDNFSPEEIVGAAAKLKQVDGKYYAYPTKKDTIGWIINKDMFDAAGIPVPTSWTLDEFREIAKKLTKGEGANKVYGFYAGSAQFKGIGFFAAGSLLGGDGSWKIPGKETNYDHPVFKKSLQTLVDMMLVDKSAVPHIDDVTQKMTHESMFIGGRAAISTGSFIIRSIADKEKYPHKFKTAFVPTPVLNKNDEYIFTGGVSDDLCINPKSNNIDVAWEFVKWYATEGILPMAKGGRIPAYVKFDPSSVSKTFLAGNEDLFDFPSYEKVMVNAYKTVKPQSVFDDKDPQIAKVMDEECEAAMTGKKSVDQTIADLKKRADALLK